MHDFGQSRQDFRGGVLPDQKLLAEMGKYNEELARPACCSRARGFTRVQKARASGFWKHGP